MLRDDDALQRATDQLRRLSTAPTTLEAAHEFDALYRHTIPEVGSFDPVLADALRTALADLVRERAARGWRPTL